MSDSSSSSRSSILDIPDEILVKIVLYLNARTRLAVANSCTRLHSVVFGYKELLKDLDFPKYGGVNTVADIEQYFSEETTREFVCKVNIQYVASMKPEQLNNSIGRAIHLVEINVLGTKFGNINELCSFLEPLMNLKRLSVQWPQSKEDDVAVCKNDLRNPLSRLVYLHARVYSGNLFHSLELCQNLEELHMDGEVSCDYAPRRMSGNLRSNAFKSLKIFQISIRLELSLKADIAGILDHICPDPNEWICFQLIESGLGSYYYLVKKEAICEEFRQPEFIDYYRASNVYLTSAILLKEVLSINHEDAPKTFCCFSRADHLTLKINEAVQLLKDSKYQISYLNLKHGIEHNCDLHLIASAYPNLTELVLSGPFWSKDSRKKKQFGRCLGMKGSTAPEKKEDPSDLDSSFKMFIEKTPYVRNLELGPPCYSTPVKDWDLDALNLISLWTNLRTLCLSYIPAKNGKFLINIGKECPQMEEITLDRVCSNGHPSISLWDMSDLPQILNHYRNLKKFVLIGNKLPDLTKLFTSLSKNLSLRDVRIITKGEIQRYTASNVISSILQLLHCCTELSVLVFKPNFISENDKKMLKSTVLSCKGAYKEEERMKKLFENVTDSEIPSTKWCEIYYSMDRYYK